MTALEQLIRSIEDYPPRNEQEAVEKDVILHRLRQEPGCLDRTDLIAHMTASAWTVSPDRRKVLLAYHNLYDSWAWLGGHADGEADLAAVALREVREESGVEHARLLQDTPISLEILPVNGHVKRGVWVPSHLHFNVTYLIEADDRDTLSARIGENSDVRWFDPEDAVAHSREEWFRTHIYPKLNQCLAAFVAEEQNRSV